MEELDILILGAGWTATFLIPLLQRHRLTFAATTTSGRPVAGHPTIRFKFDPSDDAPGSATRQAIAALPRARYILITFPLTGTGPSRLLAETYERTHLRSSCSSSSEEDTKVARLTGSFRFIQLGSTGVWQQPGQTISNSNSASSSSTERDDGPWITRHSPLQSTTPRTEAEAELVALGGCVLHLAGLWDGAVRVPSNWVERVGATREQVRGKGSLHMIHGVDVARAILGVVRTTSDDGGGEEGEGEAEAEKGGKWKRHCEGQRWMLTDGFVYDWWSLFAGWADKGKKEATEGVEEEEAQPTKQARWVYELMNEEGVRALPRSMEALGRCYDTREFWSTFGVVPLKGRVM